jgi:hypothetical protein
MYPRRALPGLVVLFLPAALGAQAGAADWQDYVWRKGECVALMPGKPQMLTRTIPAGANGGMLDLYIMYVDQKSVAYLLSYVDNPAFKAANAKMLEETLDKAREGAVGKGKLLKETKIKHGSYPGREILVELPNMTCSRSRLFLVEQKLYQLVIIGARDACLSKEADQFLESFMLLR